MDNGVTMPTREEMQQQAEKEKELFKWAFSLDKEKINFLMNGTFYNTAVKGYLIAAAQNANFTHEQIQSLLDGLANAFDDIGKEEAEEIYNNWY